MKSSLDRASISSKRSVDGPLSAFHPPMKTLLRRPGRETLVIWFPMGGGASSPFGRHRPHTAHVANLELGEFSSRYVRKGSDDVHFKIANRNTDGTNLREGKVLLAVVWDV